MEAFKLNNSFCDIMSYINLIRDCHVAIVSIVHCWEVAKRDIAGQDKKSNVATAHPTAAELQDIVIKIRSL